MRGVRGILLGVALTLLSACASEKGPAEQAIKGAEAAVAQVRTEAAKWAPDQVRSLDASLAAVKEKFAKGDYKAALAEAPGVASHAKEVAAAAAAKQAELTKSWEEMSAGLPKMVEVVNSRADILGFGGVQVSETETATIRDVARALGVPPPT
jgi:membrane-bound lytic murein transglycosylase B